MLLLVTTKHETWVLQVSTYGYHMCLLTRQTRWNLAKPDPAWYWIDHCLSNNLNIVHISIYHQLSLTNCCWQNRKFFCFICVFVGTNKILGLSPLLPDVRWLLSHCFVFFSLCQYGTYQLAKHWYNLQQSRNLLHCFVCLMLKNAFLS